MSTAATLTLDQFLALPETEPASEYTCEKVSQKPMPNQEHSDLQSFLIEVLRQHARLNKLGRVRPECRCVFGPPGQERALVPDVVFIRQDRLSSDQQIRRGPFRGAPDLAIEILSPDQPAGPFADKINFYLRNGVRLIWVVDPDTTSITVYTPNDASRLLGQSDTLDGGDVLPGFSLPVSRLFAELEG